MRVLAIDTALEACSAAVFDTNSGIAASETRGMARGHAEQLMPLVARVMNKAGLEFAELDRIAVTTGPGSFTGLRVGISAARGIALAAGKPAIGLSTLAGFAAPLIAADDGTQVVAAIDARHEHIFLQVFGVNGRTLVSPRMATVRAATRRRATASPMKGIMGRLFARQPRLSEATPADACALAALHAASFHHGWSENEFERLLSDRNVLAHRATAGENLDGFILSR